MNGCLILVLLHLLLALVQGYANPLQSSPSPRHALFQRSSIILNAASPKETDSGKRPSKRKILLSRDGPFFNLDRSAGKIAFGATADLVTKLEEQTSNRELITEWLSDERGLAFSIWDEKMMKDLGDSTYRLQTMNLQFVTIKLAPTVDMKMKTSYVNQDPTLPVFQLQSVNFDPNIQLLPGISMTADQLGIEIVVSGELRPSKDGMGVSGRLTFETSGDLPPPLRILPEQALKSATDTIDRTIVNFAVQSFQKGAITQYEAFRRQKQHGPPSKPTPISNT